MTFLIGFFLILTNCVIESIHPFLSKTCFPIAECENHKNVFLEIPNGGGHVGFMLAGGVYWSEKRALEFLMKISKST